MESGTVNALERPAVEVSSELLVQFMDELRDAGYNIGLNQYIAVQDLLLILTSQGQLETLRQLKSFMGPIVCSSRTEQLEFQLRFDKWVEQVCQLNYQQPLTPEQQVQTLAEELDELHSSAIWLRRWLVGTVTVLTVLMLFPATTTRDEFSSPDAHIPPSTITQGESVTPNESVASDGSGVSPPSSRLTEEIDLHFLFSPSLLDVILDNYRFQQDGFLYFLVLTSTSTLLIWRFWWNWRARLFLRRRKSNQPPELRRISMKGLETAVFPPSLIFKTAQQFRQRTRQRINALDINQTIQRSLQKGGWFIPVYDSRQVIPEYLFLIDRASYADHQAKLTEALIQQLQQNGVYITRYFFDGNAQICYPEFQDSIPQPLEVLANQYGQDRLVVISDAEAFYSRHTGAPEPWIDQLQLWEQRALLTPKPLENWGQCEFMLVSQFIVLPLTRQGIFTLAQVFRHGSATYSFSDRSLASVPELLLTRPRRWLERHPPLPAEGKQMLAELTAYLGDSGMYWIAACAVFPELHWNITVYLGTVLKNHAGRSLIETYALSNLARLPWFRHGYIPDWLRRYLVVNLTLDQSKIVHAAFRQLIVTAMNGAVGPLQLDIAEKPQSFLPNLTHSLLRLISRQSTDGTPFRDYIFLDFMAREPLLTVAIPEDVRPLLRGSRYEKALWHQRLFCLAAVVGLAIAVIVANSWWVFTVQTRRINQLFQETQTLADSQLDSGNVAAAIDGYLQALALLEKRGVGDRVLKGQLLNGLGYVYIFSGDYVAALPVLEEAIALFTDLSTDDIAGFELNNLSESPYVNTLVDLASSLGFIHQELGDFATALGYYQLAVQSDRPTTQLTSLYNVGLLEADIGQYAEAKETFQQIIQLSQELEDERDVCLETSSIVALGRVFHRQGEYTAAITKYNATLDEWQQIDAEKTKNCSKNSELIRIFNHLGISHLMLGNYATAQETFDQGLALLAIQEDPFERAILLDSVGALHQALGEFERAWSAYINVLRLNRQNGDATGEIKAQFKLGQLMEEQGQPSLAIFFYKQAITKQETIRQDLRQLSLPVQEKYQLTIEGFYRNTADLLLQQDRAEEALQVLESLKLQGVKAYPHNGFNTPAEKTLLKVFSQLPPTTSLADFISSPTATDLSESLNATIKSLPFNLEAIDDLQGALVAQPVRTAVLYPLILDDRLEILLITPDGMAESFSTAVSKTDITNTVGELQQKLKSKPLDSKPPAQELYDWLIRPVEETLAAHQIENIIYLPDGVLRYVPLAALHDGEQWLVEKYQSHNITAATVDNLAEQNPSSLSVVAGAFTDSSVTHEVQIGPQLLPFSGLNDAQQEIQNIRGIVPDSMALFNDEFTPEAMLDAVGDHRIVHLATYARFVPGAPEESFILFGDGSKVNMRDIQSWELPTVDLVVLSASETGSSFEGEGKEILGLGYQIQQTGAASVITSLWAVDATSKVALMTQFYSALSNGESKAQALKTAQIAMINSDSYNDPYAWATFILMGNGL